MPLRLKLTAAFAAAILILVVGAASYYATLESRRAEAAVNHTNQVRVKLQETQRTLLEAESGQRGYLLTADSTYLRPYTTARLEIGHDLEALRQLSSDSPVALARVDSLAQASDDKLVELAQTVSLVRAGLRDSALAVVASGRGLRVMNEARAIVAHMAEAEQQSLTQREHTYAHRQTIVTLITLIGAVLATALSVIALYSVRTSVAELEHAKSTIEEQAGKLGQQLAASQALSEQLERSNAALLAANSLTEASRRQFELLLESADEGVYGIDDSGNCTFINTAGARMLGFTREELLGKHMHRLVHDRHADGTPYPEEECPIYRAFRAGEPVRVADEVFIRKGGSMVPVEYASSPLIQDGNTVGAVVTYTDITARRAAERERERLISALARSNQELDQFAYVASHDLKAPLRGIANLSQWVEEDMGEQMPQSAREQMNLLRGRVHRLEALIDGILQYSRAGRVRTAAEAVDVGALLHEVVELLAPPPEITVTIDPDMPTVVSERTPLQQVFMNLISNAIKYNRRPGAIVRVSVHDAGGDYAFSVADNGPGIAPEYHDRIFGIFQTLESRDKVEGTGIGLSVVKKTVELRGGSVTVRSAPGEGATFTFTWPKEAEESHDS